MIKILCTGDLHLGRRSSRLPQHLDGRAHSAVGGWERIVDLALAERVDVVALSGDLVDRANRFYEAVGPLEAGLRRLAEAGVTTVAVAGNHDFDVLPRLVESMGADLPGARGPGSGPGAAEANAASPAPFHLLGRGGNWERVTIRRGDRVLHLDGWSFPAQYVRESPVASYSLPVPDDGPVLGLLHADLGQSGSQYAPVTAAELWSRGVDFWLLGHIHAPRLHVDGGQVPVLYPGSPQALDPGETGAHGVWLLESAPGRRFDARFVPLSTVRYDAITVDLAGVESTDEADARLVAAVRAHLASIEDTDALRCLSCRLRVVGRTPIHRRLTTHLEALATDLVLTDHGVTAVVERVDVATRPAHDLADLARGNDPVGVLARLVSGLEGGELDEEQNRLVHAAGLAAANVMRARPYLSLSDDARASRAPDEPTVADVVHDTLSYQASLLLDTLLAQKEEG